ncbi:MAG: LPS export ABC transporter periplasmic protein LptC [Chitinophagales bacterium]|nr:LPS export ABC transporter periplasmic protein LptC [Chitinophagales bacterium]
MINRLKCSVSSYHSLGFALLIIFFQSCGSTEKDKQLLEEKKDTVEEKGKNVEIVYSDYGKIRARIIATEVIKHTEGEPTTEFPKGLKLYMYNDSMKIESKLSANYGIAYEQKEELMVRDNVVIVNVEGRKLNSEELIWKRRDRKIYSDKYVKITTKQEIIYGEGFESNEDFSQYEIKHVRGSILKETEDFDEDF